ncbi:MAG: shikimate dehydrogenase [Thermodesulfovibrionales bacterium]
MLKISGKTKVLGLLGYPVEHSLSPTMHNAAFEHLRLDCCYVTFPVKPGFLKDAVRSVRALNLAGVNVTMPHKENVIPLLDGVDADASFIGAVNTIVNSNGKLIGYNTDGRGFMRSLSEAQIAVNKKNVLILGAGGASRAIGYYLSKKASGLFLYDIDKKKAGKLIRALKKINNNVYSAENINNLDKYDVIINATPLGLRKNDPVPVDVRLLKPRHIVCDLIYKKTVLLDKAAKKGCRTLNGLGMLLWQGAFAFELWTGKKPPVEVMLKALVENI